MVSTLIAYLSGAAALPADGFTYHLGQQASEMCIRDRYKRAGAGGESASNFALLFLHVFYTFFLKVWIFE